MTTALFAAAGVIVLLALALVRLATGPTLHDRVAAANGVALKAALAGAAIAVAARRSDWIDGALVLVLCLIVANAALLKFFRARTFQAPLLRATEAQR